MYRFVDAVGDDIYRVKRMSGKNHWHYESTFFIKPKATYLICASGQKNVLEKICCLIKVDGNSSIYNNHILENIKCDNREEFIDTVKTYLEVIISDVTGSKIDRNLKSIIQVG